MIKRVLLVPFYSLNARLTGTSSSNKHQITTRHLMFKKLLVFVAICLTTSCAYAEFTKEEKMLFNEKAMYDVYYQVNDSIVNFVEHVQITDIKMINGKQFLEYTKNTFGNFTKNNFGYIDFHSVKAIHPAGVTIQVVSGSKEKP